MWRFASTPRGDPDPSLVDNLDGGDDSGEARRKLGRR
jgi:hypothetical protein